jgi:hypothetical protein
MPHFIQKNTNPTRPQLFIFFILLALSACSAPNQTAQKAQQSTQNSAPPAKIPELDQFATKMRQGFMTSCLEPVKNREYLEKECAKRIFDSLERQYGVNWNKIQLAKVVNTQFLDALEASLSSKMANNQNLKSQIQSKFTSPQDFIRFYREHYFIQID